MFSISIECLHPDPLKKIRMGYKYESVCVSPNRYLSEPCFMSASQLSSFVRAETREIQISLVIKKKDQASSIDDAVL